MTVRVLSRSPAAEPSRSGSRPAAGTASAARFEQSTFVGRRRTRADDGENHNRAGVDQGGRGNNGDRSIRDRERGKRVRDLPGRGENPERPSRSTSGKHPFHQRLHRRSRTHDKGTATGRAGSGQRSAGRTKQHQGGVGDRSRDSRRQGRIHRGRKRDSRGLGPERDDCPAHSARGPQRERQARGVAAG